MADKLSSAKSRDSKKKKNNLNNKSGELKTCIKSTDDCADAETKSSGPCDLPKANSDHGTLDMDRLSFENELCWCLSQLQIGLHTQKSDSKQAKEAVKILNILSNPATPYIRKRQLMQTTFGDYRGKMEKADRQTHKQMSKVKLKPVNVDKQQSQVYHKSSQKVTVLPNSTQTEHKDSNTDTTQINSNVTVETSQNIENSVCTCDKIVDTIDLQTDDVTTFIFQRSDNSFKFAFSQPDVKS